MHEAVRPHTTSSERVRAAAHGERASARPPQRRNPHTHIAVARVHAAAAARCPPSSRATRRRPSPVAQPIVRSHRGWGVRPVPESAHRRGAIVRGAIVRSPHTTLSPLLCAPARALGCARNTRGSTRRRCVRTGGGSTTAELAPSAWCVACGAARRGATARSHAGRDGGRSFVSLRVIALACSCISIVRLGPPRIVMGGAAVRPLERAAISRDGLLTMPLPPLPVPARSPLRRALRGLAHTREGIAHGELPPAPLDAN